MPVSKDIENPSIASVRLMPTSSTEPAAVSIPPTQPRTFDNRLTKTQGLVLREQYVDAIRALPADSRDPETKNAIAVCLMRLGQFEQAIPVLRSIALNSSLQTTSQQVPQHIRVNFATALFFGGQPAGGLDVVNEVNCPDDPGVWLIRDSAREWVSQMSFLRKIDWMLNRIAPKVRPVPVRTPVGQFVWDVA